MQRGMMLVVAGAALISTGAMAGAQTLFTTQDDWSTGNGWSGQSGSTIATVPSTVFDADLSPIDGAGNFATPSGTSLNPGALQINIASGGYQVVAEISNENSNNAFISLVDPGAAGNTAVPYSGVIDVVYTQPTLPASGGYFQIGLFLQYSGDGYYGPTLSSSQTPIAVGVNNTGEPEYLAQIPYSIVGTQFNGFGFGIFENTNAAGGQAFYVDDMYVQTPEPASISLAGTGLVGLLMRRRRH